VAARQLRSFHLSGLGLVNPTDLPIYEGELYSSGSWNLGCVKDGEFQGGSLESTKAFNY